MELKAKRLERPEGGRYANVRNVVVSGKAAFRLEWAQPA